MDRNWKVGCAGFPTKLTTYLNKFTTVEIQETFYDPPGKRTLTRWRRQAPEGFTFTIRAWQLITHPASYPGYQRVRRPWEEEAAGRFGFFRPGEQTQWAWGVVRETAEILAAAAILFRTPASFTPSHENRENIFRFFSDLPRGRSHLVWEAEGLWEEEEVHAICRELDLIPAMDPMVSAIPVGEVFYFRLPEKVMTRGRYTPDDFYRICQLMEMEGPGIGREGYFICCSPNAVRDAHNFQSWVRAMSP